MGSAGQVEIGNNVFIGMHTTILKGVHIGNNVIIGANALVNKDIPDNCVVAGNPCRIVMSLEKYYEKRKAAQLDEAIEMVKLYRQRTGKEVNENVLREFFWLFTDQLDNMPKIWKDMNSLVGNREYSEEVMRKHEIRFKNMSAFLDSIK
ncbi:MAG: hypothetical protein KH000_00615 [Coprococcus comes]|nr:hypothetical protein [Coprococcus comes]